MWVVFDFCLYLQELEHVAHGLGNAGHALDDRQRVQHLKRLFMIHPNMLPKFTLNRRQKLQDMVVINFITMSTASFWLEARLAAWPKMPNLKDLIRWNKKKKKWGLLFIPPSKLIQLFTRWHLLLLRLCVSASTELLSGSIWHIEQIEVWLFPRVFKGQKAVMNCGT